MMDIKEGLLLWSTNFLIKSPQVAVLMRMQNANDELLLDLAEELHKPIIKDF